MGEAIRHENFKKILFCTDFSENADRAFVFAANTAVRNVGCELHLLHVIPEPPAQFWKGYIYEVDEDVDARAKREIDAKLAETYQPRVPAGVKLVIAMRIGEARHKILEYAQEQNVDLIILGRQGAGAVGKILFGNVTERVVRKADCPVLVIPPSPK
ncbi:MAG TPA: universal stress protein [Kiritimatiellia bacterium]|nr:universal stress protein [Kiritimatiellia bacterium]